MGSREATGRRAATVAVLACGVCLGAFACASIVGINDDPPPTVKPKTGSVASKAKGVSLSTEELTIGGGCNKKSSIATVEITNGRTAPLKFTAEFARGNGFAVEGADPDGTLHGEIAPGAVKPVSVSLTTSEPGDQESDLIINFDGEGADTKVQRVRVAATVGGGKLSFVPSIADFGEVRYQTGGAPLPLEITNSGNAAVKIAQFANSTPFAVTWENGGQLVIPAGQRVMASVTFPANTGGPDSTALSVKATADLADSLHCGDVPLLAIVGRRISTDVNVEPNTVDFGRQFCTQKPAPKTITLTNFATNQPYTFSATFPAGSRYMVDPPMPTVVAPMTSATIKIIPLPIAPTLPATAQTTEDLTISLTPPPQGGQAVRTAKVMMEIRGVTFAITPATLDFNVDPDGGVQQIRSFKITNTGNIKATALYTFSPTMGAGAFTVEQNDSISPLPDSNDIDVTFKPPGPGTYAGDIATTVMGDPPLCVAVPKVTVTGTQ